MISQLKTRYEQACSAAGMPAAQTADVTVVFDAGQNSEANFAHLESTGLHWIGSVPASDCPDLTALPASKRTIVDRERFGGLTAYDTRRAVYGAERRAILTHSPELRESQARGFDGTTLAKAGRKLDELAATLARGKTRRAKDKVQAEIEDITLSPGCGGSSAGNWPATSPGTSGRPGASTREPARSWKRRSSASTC